MPINIDNLDPGKPVDGPKPDLAKQVAELQEQVQALRLAQQELANYCNALEGACRSSFEECPGVAPFPLIVPN